MLTSSVLSTQGAISEAHCAIHASPNSPVAANLHAPSGNIRRHVAVKQWEVRPDGAMRFAYCALRGLITINSTAEYAMLGASHYARARARRDDGASRRTCRNGETR